MNVLHRTPYPIAHWARLVLTSIVWISLAACQAGQIPLVTPDASSSTATGTPAAQGEADAAAVADVDPLSEGETTGPVRLLIPEINLDVPVIAMGWRLAVVDGVRTTVWDLPEDKAGWHMNSARAGEAGNTVISGRQVGGAAVFAPLALGAVSEGQEVHLVDADGITFVYRIRQVTEPLPITGATPQEEAQAAAYIAPGDEAGLTLVTGWPEFTTTHRIFALADFVGVER